MLAAFASKAEESFASFDVHPWQWAAFVGLVAVLLLADLLLLHRESKPIPVREAAIETAVWVAIGLGFGGLVLAWHGGTAAGEYWSGYLIELSLSVDNVFVWAVILTFFAVPAAYQFRVLFWGIFGALVLRAGFIFTGVALIQRFEWVLYVFGVFLLFTAVRIARHDESEVVDYEQSRSMRLVRRLVPSTTEYDGHRIFTTQNTSSRRSTATAARRLATPLFAVLVLVETTDVVFAVDSIPAILAVAREQFIVFSSNAFAILGLRSIYFLLAGMAGRFRFLNVGLGFILGFVGVKMLLTGEPVEWHPPEWLSLAVIAVILGAAVLASIAAERRDGPHALP